MASHGCTISSACEAKGIIILNAIAASDHGHPNAMHLLTPCPADLRLMSDT